MSGVRALPVIVKTLQADDMRRREIIESMQRGEATSADRQELRRLETERHVFDLACRRWAPINPLVLGFDWGEELRHEAGGDACIVREEGMVEMGGETMPLEDATRRLAANGVRASLGGWRGRAGTVAHLAGLAPPAPSTDADRRGKPKDDRTYDLFG